MSDATTPTSPRSRWFKLVWIVPVVVVVVAAITVGAQLLRATPVVHSFLTPYPGYSKLPAWAPVGFPAWLEWQHFLSAFFIVFIIRTGWQVHTTTRAEAYWTRNNRGLLKTIRAAGPYPAASVVSPRRRRALRSQRHRLLRADLRHLAMGSDCADPVGCLSQRNLGRHPVRVTSLADRRWLVKLQRPPAAHVFRDRFHRSAPGHLHRAADGPGTGCTLGALRQNLPSDCGAQTSLPGLHLFHRVHRGARHPGTRHGSATEPEPHVWRKRPGQLGRLQLLRRLRRIDGRRLVRGTAITHRFRRSAQRSGWAIATLAPTERYSNGRE
jgi:hypothetical protein